MKEKTIRVKARLLEEEAEDVITVNGRLYHVEVEGDDDVAFNSRRTSPRGVKGHIENRIRSYIENFGSAPQEYEMSFTSRDSDDKQGEDK